MRERVSVPYITKEVVVALVWSAAAGEDRRFETVVPAWGHTLAAAFRRFALESSRTESVELDREVPLKVKVLSCIAMRSEVGSVVRESGFRSATSKVKLRPVEVGVSN